MVTIYQIAQCGTISANSQLDGRWVDAVDLQPGDTVFLQGAGATRIEAVRTETANYPVYNFAVDNLKWYSVGKCSVLVHNSNGIEVPAGTPVGRILMHQGLEMRQRTFADAIIPVTQSTACRSEDSFHLLWRMQSQLAHMRPDGMEQLLSQIP